MSLMHFWHSLNKLNSTLCFWIFSFFFEYQSNICTGTMKINRPICLSVNYVKMCYLLQFKYYIYTTVGSNSTKIYYVMQYLISFEQFNLICRVKYLYNIPNIFMNFWKLLNYFKTNLEIEKFQIHINNILKRLLFK